MFISEGVLVFFENNLFLVFEEISNPLDIHGFRNELKVFGFTSISGKATSPASLSIWKKQSKEDLGSSFITLPQGAVLRIFSYPGMVFSFIILVLNGFQRIGP